MNCTHAYKPREPNSYSDFAVGWMSHSQQGQAIFLPTAPKRALGLTQSPNQWLTTSVSQGVKRPGVRLHARRILRRLRIRVDTLVLLNTSSCRGA
jgi:hypothetical protein